MTVELNQFLLIQLFLKGSFKQFKNELDVFPSEKVVIVHRSFINVCQNNAAVLNEHGFEI